MEEVLKAELAKLNSPFPKERISLRQALSSERPGVPLTNGDFLVFKREELELLAKLVPEEERELLRLPILLVLDPGLGRGAVRIGEKLGARAIGKLLGKEVGGGELVIYRPELLEVRRKLPTTTHYLFLP
ncbi:MAG: DUF61 family protein [Candidatus Hadarchaeales archaeon]